MRNMIDVSYLTLPVDSANQGTSLVEYLHRHGIEAAADGPDAVTVPIFGDQVSLIARATELRSLWASYWEFYDAELFGLPVFTRTHNEGDHCPTCGAGPVVG